MVSNHRSIIKEISPLLVVKLFYPDCLTNSIDSTEARTALICERINVSWTDCCCYGLVKGCYLTIAGGIQQTKQPGS